MMNRETMDALVKMAPAMSNEQGELARGIYRLLAEGAPVADARVATATARTPGEIRPLMEEIPGIFRNDEDEIVGFLGLTIQRTPHEIEIAGRTLYAWCALDTLFLPRALGRSARVRSKSPHDDRPIELEVTPESARAVNEPELVMSIVRPDPEQFRTNVLSSFCHHIFFFRSREQAETWMDGRTDVDLMNLKEAQTLATRFIDRLLPRIES